MHKHINPYSPAHKPRDSERAADVVRLFKPGLFRSPGTVCGFRLCWPGSGAAVGTAGEQGGGWGGGGGGGGPGSVGTAGTTTSGGGEARPVPLARVCVVHRVAKGITPARISPPFLFLPAPLSSRRYAPLALLHLQLRQEIVFYFFPPPNLLILSQSSSSTVPGPNTLALPATLRTSGGEKHGGD